MLKKAKFFLINNIKWLFFILKLEFQTILLQLYINLCKDDMLTPTKIAYYNRF